jgi:hypothetical protein
VTTVPVPAGEDIGRGLLRRIERDLELCPPSRQSEELPRRRDLAVARAPSPVDEARRRIREALELFVDDARKATIVDDVIFSERCDEGDSGLRDPSEEGRRRKRRAVRVLRTGSLKMSARDAARLLA